MATRTMTHISNDVVRKRRDASTIVTASRSYTKADSDGIFDIATDALVQTLPLITTDNIGMKLTFRMTAADGVAIITLAPNALDGFEGTIVNAAADAVASGVVDKDLVLTKATSNDGDLIVVQATALTRWSVLHGIGIWASQA